MATKTYWKGKVKEDAINNILELISQGKSVNSILRGNRDKKKLPNADTFYAWLRNDEILADRYARACELRTDVMADEILQIADERNADIVIVDGEIQVIGSTPQRARLQIDARKWLMAKLMPKKYGDKLDLNVKADVKLEGIDIKTV